MSDIFRYRNKETPETNYLRWLCDDVDLPYDDYKDVASTLLYFPFNDKVENDVNRTYDAIANREHFESDYNVVVDIHNNDLCGLLEMMVVLARRMADLMYEAGDEDATDYYFWVMFKNLGLDKFDEERYDHQKVAKICHVFNNREYDDNGKGGLFRIKHPPFDIHEAEIWSQANWFLTENYSGF